MKDICYVICPITNQPILVLEEPIRGIHLNLCKNTWYEEEYLFWYRRVEHLKDEIDFQIIDKAAEPDLHAKLKFHAERLRQSGYQIINSEGNPFRINIYIELISALRDFCDIIPEFPNNTKSDSFHYKTEGDRTWHLLNLLDELIIRAEPRIQIESFHRFLVRLIQYTVIIKRHFGFSVNELSNILYKREFDFDKFQRDLRINLGRSIPDEFYEEMKEDILNDHIELVQLIIRMESQVVNYFDARLRNEVSKFKNKNIDSTKFFLINSLKLQRIETDMIELIFYILDRYQLNMYSEFKAFNIQSILISNDKRSDYRYLADIWYQYVRRFSDYESSKPNVGKARKRRYESLSEIGFHFKRIENDYKSFERIAYPS